MNNNLMTVIRHGYKLKEREDLNKRMFEAWIFYSLRVLRINCRDEFLNYQYANICSNAVKENHNLKGKIDECINFLISVFARI